VITRSNPSPFLWLRSNASSVPIIQGVRRRPLPPLWSAGLGCAVAWGLEVLPPRHVSQDVAIFNTCVSPIRSEKGQASNLFLCISISHSCIFLRVRVLRISDVRLPFSGSQEYPRGFSLRKKRGKAVRARGGRERASVSPCPSRLYPACTARWVPHSFRPLESSSRTLPWLPFETWESKCKARLGTLRARTLFSLLA